MIFKQFRGEKLSCLGMGNMRLPVQGDEPGAPIDRARAQEIIDYAMANGINYYDTAYVYHDGESESFLGEALKKYPRDSYYLATKYLLAADPDYKAVFERQLERLQTDHIDFYLIHAIFDKTGSKYMESGCVAYFLEQKKAGRIKYLGFSSHAKPAVLEQFADYADWDFAQLQMNYFDWNYSTTRQEYQILEERKIPIMVMEPVRGGRLAALTPDAEALLKQAHPDWSIASWALRWVKNLPQVQVVLSGMSTLEQIQDNVATFADDNTWSAEDETILMRACELFHNEVQVPCTACRYCCADCPVKINIPNMLKIYNDVKLKGSKSRYVQNYKPREGEGQPWECVGCGACTEHCPQNIDVPAAMRELAEALKKE